MKLQAESPIGEGRPRYGPLPLRLLTRRTRVLAALALLVGFLVSTAVGLLRYQPITPGPGAGAATGCLTDDGETARFVCIEARDRGAWGTLITNEGPFAVTVTSFDLLAPAMFEVENVEYRDVSVTPIRPRPFRPFRLEPGDVYAIYFGLQLGATCGGSVSTKLVDGARFGYTAFGVTHNAVVPYAEPMELPLCEM